jgi:hypothetical protein
LDMGLYDYKRNIAAAEKKIIEAAYSQKISILFLPSSMCCMLKVCLM